jgi:hypothetical protein
MNPAVTQPADRQPFRGKEKEVPLAMVAVVNVLAPAIGADLTGRILEQEFAFDAAVLALLNAAFGAYLLQRGFSAQR